MDDCVLKRREVFANERKKIFVDRDAENSSMDEDSLASDSEWDRSSSHQSLMLSIIDERKRDYCSASSSERDDFFLIQDHNAFWASLFSRHFVDSPDDTHKDDLLFYVRKTIPECEEESVPQCTVEVYRKWSTGKPLKSDSEIDYEETVYLNFILQHFEYYVTCAICTRTVDNRPEVLRKLTQRVYASPSHRKMDSKGTEEEITYPNIYFTIDNFEEAFANQVVRENEMVCVELVAVDCTGTFRGVLFRGSVGYTALKEVFDTKASLGQRMSLSWWFKGPERVEFIKMRGPSAKGVAEMAVSAAKPSVLALHSSQVLAPENSSTSTEEFHNQTRRSSDPNFGWHRIFHGSLKRVGLRKSRSNMENLGQEGVSSSCTEEQLNSSSIEESDETGEECNSRTNNAQPKPMSQSWHWWRERKSAKASSIALNSFLTYVSLPWHRIISDLCGENGSLPAFFFSDDDRVQRDA